MAVAATVVIATRNRLPYLEEAVGSVLAQGLDDWELVVVDDASTDGTWAWVQSLAEGDRRIRAVRRDEHGERAAARNSGLAETRREAVLFLDDDDRLAPSALRRLTASLARHPEVFAAVGARAAFGDSGRYRYPFPRWPMVRAAWREALAGWVATPGQMLVRAEFLRAVGGWSADAVPAEDLALWLAADDRPAAFVPATVLQYRIHPGPRPPADVAGIEDGLRSSFIAGSTGTRHQLALALVAAHRAIRDADAAFAADDPRQAARCLSRALRLAPCLLRSPILGPSLTASMAKAAAGAVAGDRAWRASRRVVSRVRSMTGRAGLPD